MMVQTEAEEREAAVFELAWIIGRGEKWLGMLPAQVIEIIADLPRGADGRIAFTLLPTSEIAGLSTSVRGVYLMLGVSARAFRDPPPPARM